MQFTDYFISLIFFSLLKGEVIPFKSYLHRYPTPYLASKSSNPLWYAIRRASAHIIVLSSYSPFGNLNFLLSFLNVYLRGITVTLIDFTNCVCSFQHYDVL